MSTRCRWLPEICLVLVTLFFCFRELGTFPAPWVDEGLFIQVARNVAAGKGYVLQVLTYNWPAPYILGVGPTVILPSALTLKLFGDSVAAARAAAAGMTVLTSLLFYVYCRSVSDRWSALFSTALLVTLSAFINTGKTVLGEVPAFGFLLMGLLMFQRSHTDRGALLAGVFFGLSAVTKITQGIIFPAFFATWIIAILHRRGLVARRLFVAAIPAILIFLAWQMVEHVSKPGGLHELIRYGLAGGVDGAFAVLRANPSTLLRFPFLYFGAFFAFAVVGLRTSRRIADGLRSFIIVYALLYILYFIHGPLWYRHLLSAHLILLPFVPGGMFALASRRLVFATIATFVVAQAWWQFDHRGSTPWGEAAVAATRILERFPQERMVISAPDLYVLLPDASHRLFLSEEVLDRDFRMFPELPVLPEEHCLPWVRKLGWAEQAALGNRVTELYRRYVLISPPSECTQ